MRVSGSSVHRSLDDRWPAITELPAGKLYRIFPVAGSRPNMSGLVALPSMDPRYMTPLASLRGRSPPRVWRDRQTCESPFE